MDAELALSNLSVCNRVFAKSKGCVITVAVDAASVAHENSSSATSRRGRRRRPSRAVVGINTPPTTATRRNSVPSTLETILSSPPLSRWCESRPNSYTSPRARLRQRPLRLQSLLHHVHGRAHTPANACAHIPANALADADSPNVVSPPTKYAPGRRLYRGEGADPPDTILSTPRSPSSPSRALEPRARLDRIHRVRHRARHRPRARPRAPSRVAFERARASSSPTSSVSRVCASIPSRSRRPGRRVRSRRLPRACALETRVTKSDDARRARVPTCPVGRRGGAATASSRPQSAPRERRASERSRERREGRYGRRVGALGAISREGTRAREGSSWRARGRFARKTTTTTTTRGRPMRGRAWGR